MLGEKKIRLYLYSRLNLEDMKDTVTGSVTAQITIEK